MSKKHQKKVEQQLIEIINARGTQNRCGECGAEYPTWASYNLGVFLCGRCASLHRRLGQDISKVKSLTLDNWNQNQIEALGRLGNKRSKKIWNPKKIPFPFDEDDDAGMEQYLRDKYINGKFRDEPINDEEYHDGFSRSRYDDDSDGGRSSRPRSRAASHSAVPRLSHKTMSSSEKSQYSKQLQQLKNLGFADTNACAEALTLARGNINAALDILNEDSNSEEKPPPLPRRPTESSGSGSNGASSSSHFANNNPMAGISSATAPTVDWWSGAQATGVQGVQATGVQATGIQTAQAGQPQIYQYTDPTTGVVSYIDANGQQYLDPNNPQHQLQLQNMQTGYVQPAKTGMDKSSILSLYSQPDSFSTNVAVAVDPSQQQTQPANQFTGFGQPTLQQQQLQQQQLQQQQLQQQQLQQQQLLMQQQMYQQQLQQQQFQPQQFQGGYWG